jgi:hypothetical protein
VDALSLSWKWIAPSEAASFASQSAAHSERFLPQVCGLQGSKNAFGGLVEAGYEFRFVDDVPAESQLADADRVFQEIHDGSLFDLPGSRTEHHLQPENLNYGVFQGAAYAFQ